MKKLLLIVLIMMFGSANTMAKAPKDDESTGGWQEEVKEFKALSELGDVKNLRLEADALENFKAGKMLPSGILPEDVLNYRKRMVAPNADAVEKTLKKDNSDLYRVLNAIMENQPTLEDLNLVEGTIKRPLAFRGRVEKHQMGTGETSVCAYKEVSEHTLKEVDESQVIEEVSKTYYLDEERSQFCDAEKTKEKTELVVHNIKSSMFDVQSFVKRLGGANIVEFKIIEESKDYVSFIVTRVQSGRILRFRMSLDFNKTLYENSLAN